MKITIEPDMEGESKRVVFERVYGFALVGDRRGEVGPIPVRKSYAHPDYIYELVEKLYGAIHRLLPLATPTELIEEKPPPLPEVTPDKPVKEG